MKVKATITQQAMYRAGLLAVKMIRERTLAGKDVDGKPFKPYGTRVFARPAGGLTKAARSNLRKMASYFRKGGSLWMAVQGGYKAYKEAVYGDSSIVNLQAEGHMLRALTVLEPVDTQSGVVRVGFTRSEEAEKAYWHNVSGAGKSRAIRRFMGLSEAEKRIIAKDISDNGGIIISVVT